MQVMDGPVFVGKKEALELEALGERDCLGEG